MLAAIAALQISCSEEIIELGESDTFDEIVLGDRLDNPFSLHVMQTAVSNLRTSDSTRFSFLPATIKPTHRYMRFLPKTEQELDELLRDSLTFTDYPVEFELKKEGLYYHDPSLANTEFTYLYAAVPVGHQVNSECHSEILEELYLPETTDVDATGRSSESFSSMIEAEAFRIAGLDPENTNENASARSNSKWNPGGRVTVWDDRLMKFIPLAGVKVQARRWFYIHQTVTDENGNFTIREPIRGAVRYRILFERQQFDIRSGTFGQAKIEGPKKQGDWNVEIKGNTLSFHFAHAFRAAMRYYYGDIGGLTRPQFRLKYAVFDKQGNHAARNIGNWSLFGINPNILLYRFASDDGREYHADEMFSNTCHETAHTTHMQVMSAGAIQFLQVSEKVRESWAVGIEWFLTQREYKEKGIVNYGDPAFSAPVNYPALYAFQYWNKRRSETLTSLFIDIVDTNNQHGQRFGYSRVGTVDDAVSGYSFARIEHEVLRDTYGIESLSTELKKSKPAEVKDEDIDLLMKFF